MRAKKIQQLREQRATNRIAAILLVMFVVAEITEAFGLMEVQKVIYAAMYCIVVVGIIRFVKLLKTK